MKEIEYAQKKGIKIIITDHHLKTEKIPKADAIFHIPALSGSGVSYFFSKEIYMSLRAKRSNPNEIATPDLTSDSEVLVGIAMTTLENNFKIDYLALASIGTVADLVPLIGPSRSVVKFGLEAFLKTKRYGLKHILKEAGIENKKITPYEIGFIIAPRINAVGRLGHAIDALRLLCTTNNNRAKELASHLGSINRLRQDEMEKSIKEAETILQDTSYKLQKIIILISDHWHEGIIGLIASKIAEKYYRPTLILTKNNDFYKGSARSIPGFDITGFLRNLNKTFPESLIDVGGHKAAAGFTIQKEKLTHFSSLIKELSEKLIKDEDLIRKIEADIKIPLSKISLGLVYELEKLAPFGIGNPNPTFFSQGELVEAKIFGKQNTHLKLSISNYNSNYSLDLIAFNQADKFTQLSRNQKIDVIYRLEIDRWGNQEKIRGIAQYIKLIN